MKLSKIGTENYLTRNIRVYPITFNKRYSIISLNSYNMYNQGRIIKVPISLI